MVIIFIVLDSKNILVVEDDLDIRELISFNLQNEGHQVFEAKDGEAGIDKAREKLPDLILLDLMLPGIQGLDVCRVIKSDQETKETPIIMVTALGQEEDIVKGLETGADDYITKPFSIKVLIARVNAVLKRSIEVGEDKSKDILINGINIKTRSREVRVNENLINDLTFSEFQIFSISNYENQYLIDAVKNHERDLYLVDSDSGEISDYIIVPWDIRDQVYLSLIHI